MVDPGTASLVLGGMGLLGGKGAQREASRYRDRASQVSEIQAGLMNEAGGIARNFNPGKEAQAAVDEANARAGATLQASMKRLNTEFKNAGGSPGGDTAFDTNMDRVARGVLDPLRAGVAQALSNQTMAKLNAFQAAIGMGGGLAENFMQLSDAARPDMSGSYGLLAGGINDMINRGKGRKMQGQLGQQMFGWGLGRY